MALREPAPSGTFTTTALVNNVHCASCLTYICEVLAALQLAPLSITANYTSRELTIIHSLDFSGNRISRALSDAAFQVRSVRTENQFGRIIYEQHEGQDHPEWLDHAGHTLGSAPSSRNSTTTAVRSEVNSQRNEKHMEHCLACQSLNEKDVSRDFVVAIPEAQKFSATLSIAGMTCAACILSITEGVQQLDFLGDISVSLITNSATVTYAGQKDNIDLIVERIEDRGFDCHVESVAEIGGREDDEHTERTVMIKIAGMVDGHCPQQVLEVLLSSFQGLLTADKAASLDDPIIKITYCPQQGVITIRDILSKIHGINSQYKASIYHPPTIEERSQAMQRHERHSLLVRLILCFIVAIPTFLISVVWVSLMPPTNHLRMFFEERMWVGADTRVEWALFFLATPVMFFAADIFHVRAANEIRALWGRNSKVPILRRFYRFGSMNLLMSAGTSVAYFPSIAVLALNSRKTGERVQTSTYFDAVIFLTMFILAGRYLEAYSKAKTGDAVTLLGKLRPSEALLLRSNPDSEDSLEDGRSSLMIANVEKINVDLLEVGDMVRVLHGASPPADGTVISGDSACGSTRNTGQGRRRSISRGLCTRRRCL
jgi:Cu+-exporting ATPase